MINVRVRIDRREQCSSLKHVRILSRYLRRDVAMWRMWWKKCYVGSMIEGDTLIYLFMFNFPLTWSGLLIVVIIFFSISIKIEATNCLITSRVSIGVETHGSSSWLYIDFRILIKGQLHIAGIRTKRVEFIGSNSTKATIIFWASMRRILFIEIYRKNMKGEALWERKLVAGVVTEKFPAKYYTNPIYTLSLLQSSDL